MSTQRQELTTDTSNEVSLEEQAKTQEATNSETEVKVNEVDNTTKSTDEIRPEWLPEKFANAEDLAKAYSELEKKQSTEVEEVQQASEQTQGLDKFYEEFATNKSLSDKSYKELEKMGLDLSLIHI